MVAKSFKEVIEDQKIVDADFKWSSIHISEVGASGGRIDASAFNVDARAAADLIATGKWPSGVLSDFVTTQHRPRFKRIYVDEPGIAFYQPAQITELDPPPAAYISEKTDTNLDQLRVKKGQLLLTCSGTVGNVTYVGNTLDGRLFSHDLMRLDALDEFVGYVYAFLKSETGRLLVETNNYGAVIQHVEPEHLKDIPIPKPSTIIRKAIHDLIIGSFDLRDESNALIKQAQAIFSEVLGLDGLNKVKPKYFSKSASFINFEVPIQNMATRLDASYHDPEVAKVLKHLEKHAPNLVTVDDPLVSKEIRLPGQFKRVYVPKKNGLAFFSGKDIGELDPSDKKYIAVSQHAERIASLTLRQNMILVTCSGTLGNTNLVPKHWDGWVMTHDIIRIIPANNDISGYLYVWLSSNAGRVLTTRYAYGATVQHIEDHQLAKVPVPLIDAKNQKVINDLVLAANQKRFEAYQKEQAALKMLEEMVLIRQG